MNREEHVELWGGLECTINRVGDEFIDQLSRSGHYLRLDDLDRIAALGIRRLRYPVLWERVAPNGLATADWEWSDRVLERMQALGIDPMVGLVHHGSGPASTHLLDPGFVEGVAEFAAAVSARYPWVRTYTPINEPLTTARFSALYGHWYPHAHDDRSFVAALLIQCRAVVAAMAAIRATVPDAELVQTEDAGFTRSTPALVRQAQFENERRWLSIDLLTGRVRPGHPLWGYLQRSGADEQTLAWFCEHATTPAVIGLNYYLTSDRYLDERLDRYPAEAAGGNRRMRYADVAAAAVHGLGIRGHRAVLEEGAARYGLPVAITEAHVGCTREEQMRWLLEAWRGANEAKAQGVDVRAVTTWAMLGSWDWDSLVTRPAGHYESGVFDVRSGTPRPTALAGLVRQLAEGRPPEHPVLSGAGWWRPDSQHATAGSSPLVILGATGTLGRAFAFSCRQRGIHFELLTRRQMDITDPESVRAAVSRLRPWAIVNAAGYVRVDDAERERVACRKANAVGPAILAAVCRKAGIRLLTFSSDLVFDGTHRRPYVESDAVSPLNIYGRTKVEAERRVLAIDPSALVVRTSAFFGPWDPHNFVTIALDALAAGRPFRAASDAVVSPTYVPDLVHSSLDLLIDGAAGVWHLANGGEVSWADFARRAARVAGLDDSAVEPCPSALIGRAATVPAYSVLGTERGQLLPDLDDSLSRYVRDREEVGTAA